MVRCARLIQQVVGLDERFNFATIWKKYQLRQRLYPNSGKAKQPTSQKSGPGQSDDRPDPLLLKNNESAAYASFSTYRKSKPIATAGKTQPTMGTRIQGRKEAAYDPVMSMFPMIKQFHF
jgi:hypothetical protein